MKSVCKPPVPPREETLSPGNLGVLLLPRRLCGDVVWLNGDGEWGVKVWGYGDVCVGYIMWGVYSWESRAQLLFPAGGGTDEVRSVTSSSLSLILLHFPPPAEVVNKIS